VPKAINSKCDTPFRIVVDELTIILVLLAFNNFISVFLSLVFAFCD